MQELTKIQSELKAPKGQFNNFGKYKYRSCEDILEALKPVMAKYECYLTLSDSIIEVAGRVFVQATAQLHNKEALTTTVKALAELPLTKKGMDLSQITGASSSYARKYALNGLFAIDDSKDADTTTQPTPQSSVDWTTKLKACKSLNELKETFQLMPLAEKEKNMALKDELKTKLN